VIIICSDRGEVKFANARLFTYTGYTLAELQADGLKLIIPPELREQHTKAFNIVADKHTRGEQSQPYRRVLPVHCKDGSFLLALVSVATVPSDNNSLDYYAFIMPLPPSDDLNTDHWSYKFKSPAWPEMVPVSTPATEALLSCPVKNDDKGIANGSDYPRYVTPAGRD
jgi:PAS domain S-box-containing protein